MTFKLTTPGKSSLRSEEEEAKKKKKKKEKELEKDTKIFRYSEFHDGIGSGGRISRTRQTIAFQLIDARFPT